MTIITGREFRSNQSKYIGMAHKGERIDKEVKEGKMLKFDSIDELRKHLASL